MKTFFMFVMVAVIYFLFVHTVRQEVVMVLDSQTAERANPVTSIVNDFVVVRATLRSNYAQVMFDSDVYFESIESAVLECGSFYYEPSSLQVASDGMVVGNVGFSRVGGLNIGNGVDIVVNAGGAKLLTGTFSVSEIASTIEGVSSCMQLARNSY